MKEDIPGSYGKKQNLSTQLRDLYAKQSLDTNKIFVDDSCGLSLLLC